MRVNPDGQSTNSSFNSSTSATRQPFYAQRRNSSTGRNFSSPERFQNSLSAHSALRANSSLLTSVLQPIAHFIKGFFNFLSPSSSSQNSLAKTSLHSREITQNPASNSYTLTNQAKAFQLTSRFEAPSPSTVQTVDDGIVSYGLFQATVRSGALKQLVQYYTQSSNSPMAAQLADFLPRLQARDESLRTDNTFLNLLKAAGNDPRMLEAQRQIQTSLYWNPAIARADQYGFHSALTQALFYDTAVQGGLQTILHRSQEVFAVNGVELSQVSEPLFLHVFLEERRNYLVEVADRKRLQGKEFQAQMLENDAKRRIEPYIRMLAAGDFSMGNSFSNYLQ